MFLCTSFSSCIKGSLELHLQTPKLQIFEAFHIQYQALRNKRRKNTVSPLSPLKYSKMSSTIQISVVDFEQGSHRSDMSAEASICFSDVEEGSSYSHFYSTNGGSYDDYSFAFVSDPEVIEDVPDSARASSVTECSVEVEIENGVPEIKVHLDIVERECRICHMGLETESLESGVPIELGCSCKDDLAAAHKLCAETWFKIKGNRTCEICHSVARNVFTTNEEITETLSDSSNAIASSALRVPASPESPRRFWQGRNFLNLLLIFMVIAFVISWAFHFHLHSH